jgi:hypothetical protein
MPIENRKWESGDLRYFCYLETREFMLLRSDDVLKTLDYFVFHTVLIGLKTECYLTNESFLNPVRSV